MRVIEWTEILDAHIKENKETLYSFGTFDCVSFCTDFVYKITDKDLLSDIKYSGYKSGTKLLERNGGLFNLTNIQMNKCGFKELDIPFVGRGDVVGYLTEAHGETLGLCLGDKYTSPEASKGLAYLPMDEKVLRAWRIN